MFLSSSLPFPPVQVHGNVPCDKSPTHTHNAYESENEDDSSSSSIGGTQTPPSLNHLRIGADARSMKSHTPSSVKSEHSSNTAHTRSPSSGSLAPSLNNNTISTSSSNSLQNYGTTTALTCMSSTSPYGVNANLTGPPPPPPHPSLGPGHFNQANPLLFHHHIPHPNDWLHGAAVAPPPNDINHYTHFGHHQPYMPHATAY